MVTFMQYSALVNLPVLLFCDADFVCDLLPSLDTSKSTRPDGVSARMLRLTTAYIVPSVTQLFNLSLRWENTIGVENISHCANSLGFTGQISPHLRPVSLLSIVSKVLERHALLQIT